jgi:sarcosine oxidase subunit alpha
VLAKVVDVDLSNEAFPFAGYREFMIQETIPVRAMRLGFVGELSYELHVPSSYHAGGLGHAQGAPEKNSASRTSAWKPRTCCAWKNATSSSAQESEQRTNLLDLGLGFLWDRKKSDAKTVGAVALRQAENDPGRLKLVGIRMEDDNRPARDGALIVDNKVRGYVATMRKSFTTGQAVGMALVESQLADKGTRLEIFEDECNGVRLYARVW